ncbi:MAG: hypothetical protein KAR83_07420 [Thermodesulfovibrionales bacterium]|nr:hypothetical protein [Thermodesulfovibrionales bacterium]
MKAKVVLIAALMLCVALVGSAFALPPGKTTVIETKMGNVTFSGDAHKAKRIGCMDCHKSTFKKAADALAMPVPHKAGEACGTCHNGDKAFSVTASCKNCHKK